MSISLINQRWIYVKRPVAEVGTEHYERIEQPVDAQLAEGEVLIANRYISVDPYMRIQQSASPNWEAPHPLNQLQQSGVVGQVLLSNSNQFREGDWVGAYTGWELYSRVHANALTRLDPDMAPVSSALGVLGMPGRTAWFGLMEAGQPNPGETVFVSGASGAVGSLVVQFAKKAGCKVVAFAGSVEKCRWLKTIGADAAINYRQFHKPEHLRDHLIAQSLSVDVYFDNVGGMITDALVPIINRRARIVICGQMSQYNGQLDEVSLGPRFLHHVLYQRATIQGILARDYNHRMDEMVAAVGPWIRDGSLVAEETIVDGFRQLPWYLASLFDRSSHGKLIVRVEDERALDAQPNGTPAKQKRPFALLPALFMNNSRNRPRVSSASG
ncbi:MAG: NADP-dependent oxidoreductase [Lysobacteraceae bacterium]|nr:MAG: NADP-dependent oxidoreductase [Xanthomonadaceae bacterium]